MTNISEQLVSDAVKVLASMYRKKTEICGKDIMVEFNKQLHTGRVLNSATALPNELIRRGILVDEVAGDKQAHMRTLYKFNKDGKTL